MSRDVLAISGLFSSHIYKATRFFYSFTERIQRTTERVVQCSKKALFCGDCCDRNQAITLVVLFLLVSNVYLLKCFSFVFWQAKEFEVLKWFVNIFVLFMIEKGVG